MKLPHLILPLLVSVSANAAIISYDFDSDTPGSGNVPAGWSVNSSDRVYVSSNYSASSPNSLFMRNSGFRSATLTTEVAIPDVTQDLVFSFDYYSPETLESGDVFNFQIDFGSGYQTVITDAGMPNGFDQTAPYTGSAFVLDSTAGEAPAFESYSIVVPSSYYNDTLSATTFNVRFTFSSGSSNEDAYIDNVSVVAVPEPSIFASLLGLGALSFVVFRRKSA